MKLGLEFGFGFLQSTSLEISVMVPKSREPCLMSQKQKHAIQDFYIYEMEQHGIFICVCIFPKIEIVVTFTVISVNFTFIF